MITETERRSIEVQMNGLDQEVISKAIKIRPSWENAVPDSKYIDENAFVVRTPVQKSATGAAG